MDPASQEAIFYHLAVRYNWLETKKEKMELLNEIEGIILPRLGIKPMHPKTLIRKLRKAIIVVKTKPRRGPKPK